MQFIDKKSLDLLNLYSKRNPLSLKDLSVIHNINITSEQINDPLQTLLGRGLIEIEPNEQLFQGDKVNTNTPFVITREGRSFLEETHSAQKTEKQRIIRYWITTGIAALALILAGISVAAQLGLILLPTLK